MTVRKIVVCNNVICSYSDDAGSFRGQIMWDNSPIDLYLNCDPDDLKEQLIVKFAFEAVFHDKERWLKSAVDIACKRFIPYFRSAVGFSNDNMEEVLPQFLEPGFIELGIDGEIIIGFKGFYIGKRESNLDAIGTIGEGFKTLQDNGVTIPLVSDW